MYQLVTSKNVGIKGLYAKTSHSELKNSKILNNRICQSQYGKVLKIPAFKEWPKPKVNYLLKAK